MKYFTISELCYSWRAEQAGIDNTPNEEEVAHLTELVDTLLDPFREFFGHPIIVNSGFRNEELNRLVGGSKTSAHRLGYAADIHVEGVSFRTLQVALLQFCKARNIAYDQIFTETDGVNQWVHVGLKSQSWKQRMQSGDWIKSA